MHLRLTGKIFPSALRMRSAAVVAFESLYFVAAQVIVRVEVPSAKADNGPRGGAGGRGVINGHALLLQGFPCIIPIPLLRVAVRGL